jgi:GLPGLI family protein
LKKVKKHYHTHGLRSMNRLLTVLLLLVPSALCAQQGAIIFDRSVQYGFEVPEGMRENPMFREMLDGMPAANYSTMVFLFDESGSLMVPAPDPEEEEEEREDPVVPGHDMRASGMAMRMRMGSSARGDQEELLVAFVNFADGTMAETREFMTRKFLITGIRPEYQWRLTGEQSEMLGYVVHKATAVQDSSHIEAWFTPEIPVQGGPGPYGGLPGMILSVSVNDGHTVYSATEVNLRPVEEGVIIAPEDGEAISREEYEEIVAEKLKEIETTQSRLRRIHGGNPN